MKTEHADDPVEDIDRGNDRRFIVRIILAELVLVLLIAVGVAGVVRGASAADPADGPRSLATPAVSLADLPDVTADVYRYAAIGYVRQSIIDRFGPPPTARKGVQP